MVRSRQLRDHRELAKDLKDRSESIGAAKDDIICVICIDSLKTQGKGGVLATPCGHLFHEDCLVEWFRTRPRADPADGPVTPRTRKRKLERGPCPTCDRDQELGLCTTIFIQSEGGNTQQIRDATYVQKIEKMLEDAKKDVDDAKKEASTIQNKLDAALNTVGRWKKEAEDSKKQLELAQKAANETQEAKKMLEKALAEAKKEAGKKKRDAGFRKEAEDLKKQLKDTKEGHTKFLRKHATLVRRIQKILDEDRSADEMEHSDSDSDGIEVIELSSRISSPRSVSSSNRRSRRFQNLSP